MATTSIWRVKGWLGKVVIYITNLIHASVDPKTVQYLAGHENSKITMDIYAKVKYNKPDELAGAMAGAFALWDATV
ncbi:MAG: hypothetical protein SPK32_07570 [Bacteroidaceae bacterium]|nr:hypothetical protein [Bacteroidaceae bacterium]